MIIQSPVCSQARGNSLHSEASLDTSLSHNSYKITKSLFTVFTKSSLTAASFGNQDVTPVVAVIVGAPDLGHGRLLRVPDPLNRLHVPPWPGLDVLLLVPGTPDTPRPHLTSVLRQAGGGEPPLGRLDIWQPQSESSSAQASAPAPIDAISKCPPDQACDTAGQDADNQCGYVDSLGVVSCLLHPQAGPGPSPVAAVVDVAPVVAAGPLIPPLSPVFLDPDLLDPVLLLLPAAAA